MAYNKNNYEHNRLTPKQEKFVEQILLGKSQRQAYYEAYPASRKWKDYSVDVAANHLMENNKVITRLKEAGYQNKKKIEWTRNKALETILHIMELNNEDLERIKSAYDREREQAEAELVKLAQLMTVDGVDKNAIVARMKDVNDRIAQLDKQRRVNATNVKGVYEGAKILNRMFGLDITKVEINTKDEEREEMEKLSVDELRELIKVSNKE